MPDIGKDLQLAYEDGFHDGYNQALSELNSHELKTVVRCKDCKHGRANDIGQIQCNMTIGDDDIHGQDWFCADGERRVDDA